MKQISWKQFEAVQMHVCTVISAVINKNVQKPAYILTLDFGEEIGQKKSSAQITEHYSPEELIGRQVVAVINFPPKQIGKMMSEVLVTGFADDDGKVVLCTPDKEVPNGTCLI